MKLASKAVLFIVAIVAVVATVGIGVLQDKKMSGGAQSGQASKAITTKEVVIAVTSKDLALPTDEFEQLRIAEAGGDCGAALKLARHYSIAKNKLEESVKSLRIAARCDDVSVKGRLISMLLATEDDASSANEIAKLLSEIRRIDVAQAAKYEEMVASQRRKLTN